MIERNLFSNGVKMTINAIKTVNNAMNNNKEKKDFSLFAKLKYESLVKIYCESPNSRITEEITTVEANIE